MDEADCTDSVLRNLFIYLTKRQPVHGEISIFRRNNNRLDSSGDICFPLNFSAWKKYINDNESDLPILDYINKQIDDAEVFKELLNESKNWIINIVKCNVNIEREKISIFLNRQLTFKNIITRILSQKINYGSTNLPYKSKIEIHIENEGNESTMDLTQLRMHLLKDVINNFLNTTGNRIISDGTEKIFLTNKLKSTLEAKKIVCGVVTSSRCGVKITDITAQEYYNKRTVDMRLMAQHKYGVRVNSEPGWSEFFEKLGNAAVAMDLLHVKQSRPVVINIENATSSHSKGVSFILYNYARLSSIFKQFEQNVSTRIYPALPELNEIQFSLLNQPEEWEILYVYLMQYPQIVKGCIKDIEDCQINISNLCTFLDALCSIFSIYYRRVRILTEPRDHLFPVLQARIYLLKATQEVLHNALALLNIPPVKQM